ncbi:MAG: hypothetical protein JSV80_15290 [Acidobacteriota bacterium]|nr:MAG: hypothetical protein JSV80_15290 [Acidobacteriota bacterium]
MRVDKDAPSAWSALRAAFLVGALADLAAGLAIFAVPERLLELTGMSGMQPTLPFDLAGLLLMVLGCVQLLVYREPVRLAPLVTIVTLERVAAAAMFFGQASGGRVGTVFFVPAAVYGVLGIAQLALIRRAAGGLWPALAHERPGAPDRDSPV